MSGVRRVRRVAERPGPGLKAGGGRWTQTAAPSAPPHQSRPGQEGSQMRAPPQGARASLIHMFTV